MSCMKKGLGPRGDKGTVKEKGRWGLGEDRGRKKGVMKIIWKPLE